MRIAVLADAHGSLLAFQAVLADLRTQAPDLLVNLGDLCTGPFDPVGSADAQAALGCPTLASNHERNLLKATTPARPWPSPARCCPRRTWSGWRACPERCGCWTARCSPATAARRAATSTACWKT